MNWIRFIFLTSISLGLSLFMSISSRAEHFYIAQSAQGGDTGSDCNNAHSASWFNTPAQWGNPKQSGKVGPGDTVHLCGTISTSLEPRANGSSDSPITIYWESNAKLSQPSASWLMTGLSYGIIDGGTNGIIELTENGDALSNQLAANGIIITGSSNLEIKNLTIQNLYVKTSNSYTVQDLTTVGAILGNPMGSNVSIHDCTFHDICWVISTTSAGTGITIYNNHFYNYDHAIAGFNGAHGLNIYNNHFGATAIWDTIGNQYHHDGIHIFFAPGGSISNANIYNNLFDGDWGISNTAHMYFECDWSHTTEACTDFNILNNVHLQYNSNILNNGFVSGGTAGFKFYNNTYLGSGLSNSIGVGFGSGAYFKNNIISGVSRFITAKSFADDGLSNNIYANQIGGGTMFDFNGRTLTSFELWQSETGQDMNSSIYSNAYLNSNGTLQSNSQAKDAGINLTSLGITALNSDILSSSRPTVGAWDIGAYEFVYHYLRQSSGAISGGSIQ